MFIIFGVQNILFLDLGDTAGVISGSKTWLSSMVIKLIWRFSKASIKLNSP